MALGSVLTVGAAAPGKTAAEAAATAAVRRQSASMQFARAEEQRAALNGKATEKRTLADYKQVVTGYRRVALITPRAPEVPDSLLAVAELYTEMGDRFGRSYYQSAADSYQFLVREYPTSRYCQDATLRAAKLQRDQLGDSALAKKTYGDFLKRYPRSPRKREAQEALAELALLQNGDAPSATNNVALNSTAAPPASEEVRANAPVHSGGKSVGRPGSREIPRVRMIRADANGDTARVTIDLEDSVQYASGRIASPERIFFDLHAARLTPEVARGNVHVDGGLLTAVRVAQNHEGMVRVVLDVNGVKEYTASLTSNPPRLSIDLYGNSRPAATMRAAKGKRGQEAEVEDSNESAVAANEARTVQNAGPKGTGTDADSAPEQRAENSKSAISGAIGGGAVNGVATSGGAINDSGAANNSSAAARNSLPSAKSSKSKSIKATSSSAKPDLIQPASAPQPTRDGQSTLTRALGLKIGRIVIDAGHGG
ncbi:MAG TPA: AMIN domain-containing protein, partial [Candidatus Dormibacteraeota bacterium]|nr:AMIN domain-containing protein [Candidatus Dormibacteraeota bacterium]